MDIGLMVEGYPSNGTQRAPGAAMDLRAVDERPSRRVWIVEDEPAAAALAEELCASSGAETVTFRAPLPFLAALRSSPHPDLVVLDWRLEQELSAALFLATRHRHPSLPVVYWTGTVGALPAMIRGDAHTRVVDKAAGSRAFEEAISWGLEQEPISADE